MNYNKETEQDKDPALWELAKRRASFQRHLATYLVMSVFFWIVWFMSGNYNSGGLPWPVWPMLGWGIGITFHYVAAYVSTGNDSVEREYQKLKQQSQN
jgi:hypothetical protein